MTGHSSINVPCISVFGAVCSVSKVSHRDVYFGTDNIHDKSTEGDDDEEKEFNRKKTLITFNPLKILLY